MLQKEWMCQSINKYNLRKNSLVCWAKLLHCSWSTTHEFTCYQFALSIPVLFFFFFSAAKIINSIPVQHWDLLLLQQERSTMGTSLYLLGPWLSKFSSLRSDSWFKLSKLSVHFSADFPCKSWRICIRAVDPVSIATSQEGDSVHRGLHFNVNICGEQMEA